MKYAIELRHTNGVEPIEQFEAANWGDALQNFSLAVGPLLINDGCEIITESRAYSIQFGLMKDRFGGYPDKGILPTWFVGKGLYRNNQLIKLIDYAPQSGIIEVPGIGWYVLVRLIEDEPKQYKVSIHENIEIE